MSIKRCAQPNQIIHAAEEWDRIGRRLADVDPDRFRRLLAIARGVVATYETVDGIENSADMHTAMLEIATRNHGPSN